ncbi:PilW family protein [Legionella sp.]|uniref:PilW family protein n=1 Tax=Legionella sp. TaxID=459 RepID=UPI003CAA626C
MKKQLGVSISEVLISLFLTSLITTLLMQFYLSSKRHYVEAEELLSQSFDLSWVGDLMSDSIRRAGFTPCLGINQLSVNDRRANGGLIQALRIGNQGQLIQINRMNEQFAKVINMQSATRVIVSHPPLFNKKHPLLIADCDHAEVQQIVSIESQADKKVITFAKPLQYIYNASAYVGEFLEERWFIKKNSRGEETLHYQLTQTEEITSLIHTLKIQNEKVNDRQFIKVIMGLDEDKTHTIRVAVRGT